MLYFIVKMSPLLQSQRFFPKVALGVAWEGAAGAPPRGAVEGVEGGRRGASVVRDALGCALGTAPKCSLPLGNSSKFLGILWNLEGLSGDN